MGPPQVSFFATIERPLRSDSSLTKWGALSSVSSLNFKKNFLNFLRVKTSLGGGIFLNFQGGASALSCPPPPCGRPCIHVMAAVLEVKLTIMVD